MMGEFGLLYLDFLTNIENLGKISYEEAIKHIEQLHQMYTIKPGFAKHLKLLLQFTK
jgi:hypothetical protein